MKMARWGFVMAVALTCSVSTLSAAHAAPSYRISGAIPLGAPDRWDYVFFDKTSGRVFVAHGDHLSVVDAKSGGVVGEVQGMPGGTHGTAVSASAGLGFTDDGEAGVAKAFDLKTLKVVKTLPAEPDADSIAHDRLTGHIFVVDGDSGNITVIDPRADAVIATVRVGGKLEYAVSDTDGHVYVNGAERKEIVRIDARTNAVDARWPIPDCTSPHGLAIDTARHRLFSSCANGRLVVLDTDTGRQIAMLPIGQGTDAAAYDSVRHRVFSSNGRDGTLTVIQQDGADAYRVLDTIKTAVSGRTMDVDPVTGRIYIAAADLDPTVAPGPNGRPRFKPGSLHLLVLDPAS